MAQIAPTTSISFAPASITSGATSLLTIALGNPNAGVATLSQPLVDSLPGGLTIVGTAASAKPCGGAPTATPGGGVISYPGGAIIPPGGCSISVNVKGISNSGNTYLTDSLPAGALQTNFGGNVAGASTTLTVHGVVTVPSLANLSQAAAVTRLQGAGLVLGTIKKTTSLTVPFNLIVSQAPVVNMIVAPGSPVNIVLSTGSSATPPNPHAPLTSVPGLVTPAQTSVAAAVERVCANLQLAGTSLNTAQSNLLANCKSIINTYGGSSGSTSQAGVKKALDAVSGMQTTAQQTTSVRFAGLQFSNLASRLAELRGGSSGFSFAGLDTGSPIQGSLGQLVAALQDQTHSGAPTPEGQHVPYPAARGGASGDEATHDMLTRWGFFVNGSLRRGTQDTTDDETGYDFRSTGLTAGADYRFTNQFVAGLAFGHANGSTEFSDGSGRVDSRNNSVSLYGTYYRNAFYLDAIGTFGHISYAENRDTTYTIDSGLPTVPSNCLGTTCTIDATGSTGARQLAFGSSAGYNLQLGGLTYGPDIALDYTRVDVNGFNENDANHSGMTLSYGDQIGESLLLKAGGHVSYAISTPIAVLMPQLRARYIHEFKDDQRGLLAHYVNDPTVTSATGPLSNFFVFTDLPDRNYFDWAAGVTAQFKFGLAGYVDYSALGGYGNLQAHEISFGVRFQYLVP